MNGIKNDRQPKLNSNFISERNCFLQATVFEHTFKHEQILGILILETLIEKHRNFIEVASFKWKHYYA